MACRSLSGGESPHSVEQPDARQELLELDCFRLPRDRDRVRNGARRNRVTRPHAPRSPHASAPSPLPVSPGNGCILQYCSIRTLRSAVVRVEHERVANRHAPCAFGLRCPPSRAQQLLRIVTPDSAGDPCGRSACRSFDRARATPRSFGSSPSVMTATSAPTPPGADASCLRGHRVRRVAARVRGASRHTAEDSRSARCFSSQPSESASARRGARGV
jgi:hypothetical protein